MAEHVRGGLEALTDDQRAAMQLTYFGGQSCREVAVALGQPEETVKSQIRGGLRLLHRHMRSRRAIPG